MNFMDLPSLKLTAKAARITYIPGTPSVPFFKATLPLNPATIALKIGHLAFQVYIYISWDQHLSKVWTTSPSFRSMERGGS